MTLLSRGLSLTLLLAVALTAQETRGRVQGSVRDPSGAVVAGAAVTLTNGDTGLTAAKSTNETGHYLFDMVVPGHYTINVAAAGFKSFVQKNVLVEVGGDITVDVAIADFCFRAREVAASLADCAAAFSCAIFLRLYSCTMRAT